LGLTNGDTGNSPVTPLSSPDKFNLEIK